MKNFATYFWKVKKMTYIRQFTEQIIFVASFSFNNNNKNAWEIKLTSKRIYK